MQRGRNKSGRLGANTVNGGEKPFTRFKDKIESMSGLVGAKDVSWACEFINNATNNTSERIAVIKSLREAMLIPDTYDKLMSALSRLSKTDADPEIKSACISTFTFHRERHMLSLKKVV